MVLPVLWENVSTGIRSVDPQLLELSRAYRFSRVQNSALHLFARPAPHFSAGVYNAIGLAWKSGVAAEVLCLPKAAIGTQVYYSRSIWRPHPCSPGPLWSSCCPCCWKS